MAAFERPPARPPPPERASRRPRTPRPARAAARASSSEFEPTSETDRNDAKPGPEDVRLVRAETLGHRYARIGRGPKPKIRGGSAGRDAGIQRLVGFELEMKVSLSRKGKHKVKTREALKAMSSSDLKDDMAIEVDDGTVFEWDEDSVGPRMLEEVLALDEGGKGRWHANPARGSRIRAETSEISPEEHDYFDPLLGKDEKVVSASEGRPFSVVEDYSNDLKSDMMGSGKLRSAHSAIAEIVTEPRDEFAEKNVFVEPMEKARDAAARIEQATDKLTKRVPANAVFAGAPADLYLGVGLAKEEKVFQSTNAGIQATFGIQLAGVPGLLSAMLEGPQRSKPAEKDVLQGALGAAAATMKDLSERGISEKTAPRLSGLLHLIAMYLIAGEQGANILKNKTPLLIRNHLANIRVQGLGAEAKLLDSPTVSRIVKSTITHAKRDPGDALMTGVKGSPKVEAWVRHALVGQIDSDPLVPLLGDMRKLGPELVGPKGIQEAAPVVEERQVPKAEGVGVDIPKAAWPDLAASYQERLRKLNQPPGPSEELANEEVGASTSFKSFGGNLATQEEAKEALPDYGPGLKPGTIIERGPLQGEILEVHPEKGTYTVQLTQTKTGTKLPSTQPLGFTASGWAVVKLP